MKKVLIISYYWPPSGGAGVQRWLKFCKYLRDYGWEPVVYTVENGEMPVIDKSLEKDIPANMLVIKKPIWEPYTLYKKFIGRKKDERINTGFLSEKKKKGFMEKISVWIRGNFFIPDARKFWIKPSVKFLKQFIIENNISAIVSSGPPHSMHLIALGLKEKYPTIKWLADFRDPWTNIDYYKDLQLTKLADKKHHQLEERVLQKADAIVSVGKTMKNEFIEIMRKKSISIESKSYVITNGFDEDDIDDSPKTNEKKFSIAHIGTLVASRNPILLWEILDELVKENELFKQELEIKLVGKVDYGVMESIKEKKLDAFLTKIDYLPHAEINRFQKNASALLLLVNNTPNAKGILTGKLFEYLASATPILAIGPVDGDLAEILNETGAGKISGFDDKNNLKNNILSLFHQHREGKLISSTANITKYSRKNLTAQLASILNSL